MPYKPLNSSLFSFYRFESLTSFIVPVKGALKQDLIKFIAVIIDAHGLFHFLGKHFTMTLSGDHTPELIWLFKVFAVIIGADPSKILVMKGNKISFTTISPNLWRIWLLVRVHLLNPLVIELGSKAYADSSNTSPEYGDIGHIIPLKPRITSSFAAGAALLLLPRSKRNSFRSSVFKPSNIRVAIKKLSVLVKLPKSLLEYMKSMPKRWPSVSVRELSLSFKTFYY